MQPKYVSTLLSEADMFAIYGKKETAAPTTTPV